MKISGALWLDSLDGSTQRCPWCGYDLQPVEVGKIQRGEWGPTFHQAHIAPACWSLEKRWWNILPTHRDCNLTQPKKRRGQAAAKSLQLGKDIAVEHMLIALADNEEYHRCYSIVYAFLVRVLHILHKCNVQLPFLLTKISIRWFAFGFFYIGTLPSFANEWAFLNHEFEVVRADGNTKVMRPQDKRRSPSF